MAAAEGGEELEGYPAAVIFDPGGTLVFLDGDWPQLLRLGALRLAELLTILENAAW